MIRSTTPLAVAVLVVFAASAAKPPAPETITPNENRQSAGTLSGGVLTVKLEARNGVWHPEGDNGRAVPLAAFAEEGKPLLNPGPLVRVPVGTEVRATLRNALDKPLTVIGFGKTRGASDSVVIPARGVKEVRFKANTPGTYYYAGRRGMNPIGIRLDGDMQLNGAIVVDPAGAPAKPNDRVFVISWWFTLDSTSKTGLGRSTMAINGLSWPHTERIDAVQGDSLHWRVINMSESDHPMHLHGFYFNMESKGNGIADSLYDGAHRRLGVTEVLDPFATMSFSWQPTRPGNWIYHCHYAGHLSTDAALDADRGVMDESMQSHHASDRPHQMFGLVLGIRVAPRGVVAHATGPARAIRLTMREKANVYGTQPGYAFVMGGTPEDADPKALPVPGPALVLQRGQPVAITIVNRAKDRAAVHWHGIELDSYPDGVPGWSGSGTATLPSVAPGDSITVRFTPPRSGTFMYHSHFNEAQQINGGLYGPIVVVDSGSRFDPETDRVLMLSSAGRPTNVVFGPYPNFLMNGKAHPGAMSLKAGTKYRFRVINISDNFPVLLSLNAGAAPVQWRAVAKDGATLPAVQATMRPAKLMSDPGEIFDFEFTPAKAGELALTFGPPPPPPGSPPPPPNLPPLPPTITVPVHVR